MKRILLSGLVAGIAFFIWLSVVHLATPLGEVGFRAIPNEAEVIGAIKNTIPNDGFYFFPNAVTPPGSTKEEKKAAMNAAMEKMKTSPTGIMVVAPHGRSPMAARLLVTEFLNDVVQGMLLAWLISCSTMTTIGGKIRFALAVGVAASLVTNISYWNWYGFPTDYTVAYMFGEIGGYLVMGLAIAVMTLKPARVPQEA
jgi:hypothetical protein